MRLRVRFQYNEETGDVEVFQVDAVAEGQRTADHDSVHDRVSTELAAVVERSAQIVEQPPHAQAGTGFLPASPLPQTQQQTEQGTAPPEALRD